jgi:hypothetical protein
MDTMTEAERYDKIEDYLKGRLSKSEEAAFEAQIAANPALASEVVLHRSMIEATGEEDVIAFEQQIRDILAEAKAENVTAQTAVEKRNSFRTSNWIWMATTALLLAFAAIWYFSRPPKTPDLPPADNNTEAISPTSTNEQKKEIETEAAEKSSNKNNEEEMPVSQPPSATAKKEPTPSIAQEKPQATDLRMLAMAEHREEDALKHRAKSEGQTESPLQAAWNAFELQQTDKAIEILSGKPSADSSEWLYLRGHAYFMEGEFQKAAEDFAVLRADFKYGFDADWNYLLTLAAQLPKTQEAYAQQLSQMTSKNHPFAKRATELDTKIQKANN